MIYLDNAATSYPKPKSVVKSVTECLRSYCGNPGRSGHYFSIKTAEKIYEARELVARLLNADKAENVIFTANATMALNYAIKGLVKPQSHCIVSDIEHNSVLRPLNKLKETIGVTYSTFNSDNSLEKEILPLIKNNTGYIISTLSSNVTGKTLNFEELSRIARENGLKLIIDASQYAGHRKIDIECCPCDAICSAGHKALFGIQGSGFLYLNDIENTVTTIEGGTGSASMNLSMPEHLPDKFEVGTLPSPSIISLKAGLDYIFKVGLSNVTNRLDHLTEYTYDILSSFKEVKIYGAENGIISFNIKDLSSLDCARMLSDENIAVRGGFHCAPTIHDKLGTLTHGAVRISYSYLNEKSDADRLYKAIKDICKIYL